MGSSTQEERVASDRTMGSPSMVLSEKAVMDDRYVNKIFFKIL